MPPAMAKEIGDLLVGTQIDPSVWIEEELLANDGPEVCQGCCTWVPHGEINLDDAVGAMCDRCWETR